MSETKPEKRLVSKGQYVQVMGKKLSLYAFGCLGSVGGCLLGPVVVITAIDTAGPLGGVIALALTAVLVYKCWSFVGEAHDIEPVEPITSQNTLLLPQKTPWYTVPTFLRPSNRPNC